MPHRDYLTLVREMGNFIAFLDQCRDIQTFLDHLVQIVASHLESDVCSVYVFDNERQNTHSSACQYKPAQRGRYGT